MVESEKKLFIIEIVLSLLLLLNIFVKNIMSDYFIFFIILVAMGIIIYSMGYEKDQNVDGDTRRKLIFYILFYSIGFIILQYGLGLFLNYVNTPYKRNLLGIFSNIFINILIIISSEYLRYMIVKKGENKKIIIVFVVILFILLDLSLNASFYDLSKLKEILKFTTSVILPSFFKNFILTIFTYRYGVIQNIVYRLILELYIYVMPFIPNLGLYLESILFMIYPFLLYGIITTRFEKEQLKDFRENKYKKRIITVSIILISSILIILNSNMFRFWIAAVGSGSMEHTIDIGDVIVIDKKYQKHLNKLKKGDILVFKIDTKIYTHRIIDIENDNEKYKIKTKGDRKGQEEDSWTVTNSDVIGVVKFKIKYIGYPTVWLSRILEGRK